MRRLFVKPFFYGAIFIVVFFSGFGCSNTASRKQNQVCFKKMCFVVEVARENEELRRGLQFRPSLRDNSGMLFVFPVPGIHQFWMKDTMIALDMIWINKDSKVIYIKHRAQPCPHKDCPSFGPRAFSSYVLEVNAGAAEKLGIQVGDSARIHLVP